MKVVLFFHLMSLVLAYGSVMFVDIYGAMWVLGKKTKSQMLEISGVAQDLIWLGLSALIITGILLHPNLSKPLTQAKMLIVLVIILNGLNLHFLRQAMKKGAVQRFWDIPKKLMLWSVASISLSQLAWLGAVIIGFINTSSRW